MGDFRLPTDAEISAMVGGIHVTSSRPEDFPHFKHSIYEGYNSREFDDRHRAIVNDWLSFCPALSRVRNLSEIVDTAAGTRSAQINFFKRSGQDKPYLYALIRPSEVIEPHLNLANTFGLRAHQVTSTIPLADSNFIDTHHEIGHMIASSKGIKFHTDFDDEFNADRHALNKYLEQGGSLQVVRDYINIRALAGFLQQPSQYWLSQALDEEFFSDDSKSKIDNYQAYLSNAELRLRVVDITDGGRSLTNYGSREIQEALALFYNKQTYKIAASALRVSVENLDSHRYSSDSVYSQDKVSVFSAVGEVLDNPNVDPATKKLAGMVADGARSFTPSLVPKHMLAKAGKPMSSQETPKPLPTSAPTGDTAAHKSDHNPPTGPNATNSIELPKATHSRMSLGAGSAGTGMAVVGLHNAIQKGDMIRTSISGLDLAVSATDVTMDGLSAAGRTISKAARQMITKANVAVVLIDGTYQISQEERAFNKAARGGAVAATAMTGFGIGGLAATVTTTGLAASAATVAAPMAATVAVAITADAAVDAFKATESLNATIKAQERGAKQGNTVGQNGAPSILNYKKLSWFAKTEGASPDGSKSDTRQAIAAKISQYSYATNPATLDELEKDLKAKIDGYDKVIKDNDSWVHDSVRFFWAGDKIDTQRTAKIERTSYVAALNELKLYRQEITEHKLKSPAPTPGPKVDPVQGNPTASAKAAFKQVKDVPTVHIDPLAPSVSNDALTSSSAQYVVQNGDALSLIVSEHYQNLGVLKNYKSIQAATEVVAKLNGIENIHKIQSEQIIRLPAADQLAKLIKGHEVNTSQWYAVQTLSTDRNNLNPQQSGFHRPI